VRAKERPPARRHPLLELLQPLLLDLARLRLRGAGLTCRPRGRDSRQRERDEKSEAGGRERRFHVATLSGP
jgi:hypothetical protein